jgi:hypothetical protein
MVCRVEAGDQSPAPTHSIVMTRTIACESARS